MKRIAINPYYRISFEYRNFEKVFRKYEEFISNHDQIRLMIYWDHAL